MRRAGEQASRREGARKDNHPLPFMGEGRVRACAAITEPSWCSMRFALGRPGLKSRATRRKLAEADWRARQDVARGSSPATLPADVVARTGTFTPPAPTTHAVIHRGGASAPRYISSPCLVRLVTEAPRRPASAPDHCSPARLPSARLNARLTSHDSRPGA
jgi:hypothetical protein